MNPGWGTRLDRTPRFAYARIVMTANVPSCQGTQYTTSFAWVRGTTIVAG